MTTILIKKKDTAGAPAAGDLTNAAGGAEIAVNTATKRVYSKDSGGTVIEMGTFPSTMAVQGALSATGNVTLGDAAADNVTVNGTITSNLIFTDATYDIGASGANRPRDLFLSRNLTVGGTLTLAGGVNLNGNVTVGDSSADTLTINSTITSNLIFTDNTYDIGASGATRPRNLYLAGLLTMGGALTVNGNATLGDATTDTVTVNGYMGIGGAADSQYGLYVQSSALTGTNQRGIFATPTATSAATSTISSIFAYPKTAAAAFTVTTAASFRADDAVKGAGSTITNLAGVYVADQTQGTNNYGVLSQVTSGTNKFNIYASGTADNYFAGNVGINTTDTTITGGVVGASSRFVVSGSAGRTQLANTGNEIAFSRNSANYISANGGTSGAIITGAQSYLRFDTGSTLTERMRIDSSGNVGIGATPSAWQVNNRAIQLLEGYASISSNNSQGCCDVAYNCFNGGSAATSGWKYTNTGTAVSLFQQQAGAFKFLTAASGTAGDAITFTQAMTLDASGSLTIGGLTATRLEVNLTENDKVELNVVDSTNTARNFVFSTGDTERMRLPAAGGVQAVTTISVGNATPSTSGAGITFPATQSASSDANTLDDYEEGSWTPTLGTNGFSGGATLSSADGTYTKVGRLVYVRFVANMSIFCYPSSYTAWGGLPFTAALSGVGSYAGGHPGSGNMGGACSAFSNSMDNSAQASATTSNTWFYSATYTV